MKQIVIQISFKGKLVFLGKKRTDHSTCFCQCFENALFIYEYTTNVQFPDFTKFVCKICIEMAFFRDLSPTFHNNRLVFNVLFFSLYERYQCAFKTNSNKDCSPKVVLERFNWKHIHDLFMKEVHFLTHLSIQSSFEKSSCFRSWIKEA